MEQEVIEDRYKKCYLEERKQKEFYRDLVQKSNETLERNNNALQLLLAENRELRKQINFWEQ